MKFPALDKRYNSKIRQEYLDMDYIGELNEKEKAWLNSFVEETLGTNFNHSGKKFYKTKRKKRELYGENNSRNRDLYSRSRAMSMLDYTDIPIDNATANIEDALIEYIDSKKTK